MLPLTSCPQMSKNDVQKFCSNMARYMKGNVTTRERKLYKDATKTYETVLKNNGGKNPIFG